MVLIPRKVKHRKHFRGKNRGKATRGSTLSFGSFGLKAEERGALSSRQIEATRRSITRFVKREGKIWIRIFPDKPVTQKGTEVGMGSGKGAVDHYVAVVKPGRILFEIDGITEEIAREAFRLASHKLSIKTRFVKKV